MISTIQLVTFDCASTLVDVAWTVDGFARDCMAHLGVAVDDDETRLYRRMYHERLPEFLEVNLTRDPRQGARFWRRLGADWLRAIGRDHGLIDPLMKVSDELAYGVDSRLFKVYDDVTPCLRRLRSRGICTAVVSNWDYSLHRVLAMFGLDDLLDLAVASLEEGVEKPDPRLFNIALERLGIAPSATVHVGDNPIDDVDGALSAGIRPVLIDRTREQPATGAIATLDQLPNAIGWID